MRCSTCKAEKPETEFYWRNKAAGVRQAFCRTCKKAYNAAWYERHAEEQKKRVRANNAKHMLRWKYGITNDDRDELARIQEGRCAICRREKPLVVDHCHKEKQVRGLLCHPCNLALGQFEDDPTRLQAAIEYLALARGSSAVGPNDG